jgi:hypothetical protein
MVSIASVRFQKGLSQVPYIFSERPSSAAAATLSNSDLPGTGIAAAICSAWFGLFALAGCNSNAHGVWVVKA